MLVDRGNRKVAALERSLVCQVSTQAVDSLVAARVPSRFARVDEVHRTVALVFVANVIKDEELCFWCEERGVCNAGAGKVGLGLLCYLTWVATVDLTVARVVNVEDHHQRAVVAKLVDIGGGDIWQKLHV